MVSGSVSVASDHPSELKRGLQSAYRLCTEALDLLDACGAPTRIARHIELALQEIGSALGAVEQRDG